MENKVVELVVCKGLPGCGKTAFARGWVAVDPKNRVRVNRDDIRRMLGPYWLPTREDLVTEIEKQMVYSALDSGYSVVVDATNFRSDWDSFLTYNGFNNEVTNVLLVIKDFTDVTPEECFRRDSLRASEEQVGKEVIYNMYNKYIKKNGAT